MSSNVLIGVNRISTHNSSCIVDNILKIVNSIFNVVDSEIIYTHYYILDTFTWPYFKWLYIYEMQINIKYL